MQNIHLKYYMFEIIMQLINVRRYSLKYSRLETTSPILYTKLSKEIESSLAEPNHVQTIYVTQSSYTFNDHKQTYPVSKLLPISEKWFKQVHSNKIVIQCCTVLVYQLSIFSSLIPKLHRVTKRPTRRKSLDQLICLSRIFYNKSIQVLHIRLMVNHCLPCCIAL